MKVGASIGTDSSENESATKASLHGNAILAGTETANQTSQLSKSICDSQHLRAEELVTTKALKS